MTAATVTGLRIFPLHGITENIAGEKTCTCSLGAKCKDVGKHPLVSWRNYDDYEPNQLGPSKGFGVPTGSSNHIFVIDLDRRPAQPAQGEKPAKPAKDGVAAFLALAAGRPIPDTASVITGSGGVHLYFRYPPELPAGYSIPCTKSELADGVDVKGDGGYVVGPGSPHASGRSYEIADGPGNPADAPDWLLALVVKEFDRAVAAEGESKHVRIDPASPEGVRAVAWAREYLAGAEPAIEGHDGSGRLYHVACHLMYSSLPLETLQELVEEVYNPRCDPPWSEKEIEHKLHDADRDAIDPRGLASPDFWDRLAQRTKDTAPKEPDPAHEYTFEPGMRGSGATSKASLNEITADLGDHVQWAGVLRFNVFRNRILAVNPPMRLRAETASGLHDNDVQLIRAWFEYHGKTQQTEDVRAAVEMISRRSPFHPVQDYLTKKIRWDGKPRLDRVLPDYFNTKAGPYELGIGPKWFISLVARAMTPGCQSDCTLILEGLQGRKKTSAFRSLVYDPLWYRETTSGVDTKDFLENLRGVWLMAFDELDSLSKGSLTRVKTTLTTLCDSYRASYGHYTDDYPRSVGFCGSTNAEQYLNDQSGGRRFWPVEVLTEIDVERIVADRDQIWAEAYVRWQAGEAWHVNTPELQQLCEDEQEARLAPDAWEEPIREWLNDPAKVSFKQVAKTEGSKFAGLQVYDASDGVTTSAVLVNGIGRLKGQWTAGDVQHVGRVLRKLGLVRVRRRLDASPVGKTEWRYVLPAVYPGDPK
jgi:predicted P-loop ATPase